MISQRAKCWRSSSLSCGQQRRQALAFVERGQDAADRRRRVAPPAHVARRLRRCSRHHGAASPVARAGARREAPERGAIGARRRGSRRAARRRAARRSLLTIAQSGALPQRSAKPCCASTSRRAPRARARTARPRRARGASCRAWRSSGSCQSAITGTGSRRRACSGHVEEVFVDEDDRVAGRAQRRAARARARCCRGRSASPPRRRRRGRSRPRQAERCAATARRAAVRRLARRASAGSAIRKASGNSTGIT